MVTNIIKQGFYHLKYLISKADFILKTIMFVNKIENAIAIAAHFCYLLPPKNQNQINILIKTFYSNLETHTQLEFIEDF